MPPDMTDDKKQIASETSRDRIARLFLLLDEKLGLLEARHGEGAEPPSAADNEKDARTMMSLLRVYEKLVEMQERAGDKAQERSGVSSDEAQAVCRTLAGRIERLREQTGDKPPSRKTKRD